MHIISKTPEGLYQACIQQVRDLVKNTKTLDKKHAFHESANFVILEPDSHKNPVSYDGEKFSHSEQSKIFDTETDHYNNLILSADIEGVLSCLKADPDSKKAYLSFWKNEFVSGKSGEIPCLVGVHFFIKEDKVFAVIQMRSNELSTLLPIDIYFGIAIQIYVSNKLKMTSGSYTHQVASLILYSKDVEKL